ncbi:MAG: hypothetical protein J6M57_06660, partial [Acidaminococcaceae bacterium]|nr:hypothetical protein [Acidaminococcaceae bacterium]
MKEVFFWLVAVMMLLTGSDAFAGQQLDAVFPYSLEKRDIRSVSGHSTMPLYINLTSFDVPRMQQAKVSVRLPEGFSALPKEGWQVTKDGAVASWSLDADYAQNFDLLYVQAEEDAV